MPSEEELEEMVGHELDSDFELLESNGVYLSGPIRCSENDGRAWREQLAEDYPEIQFNNPLENFDPANEEILNDPIQYDPDAEKEQIFPSEYVADDKMMIGGSEAVFVGLPEIIARGTCMEMMWAYTRDIPFFVWVAEGQEESGWIFDHAKFMSDDRGEVMRKLKQCLRPE